MSLNAFFSYSDSIKSIHSLDVNYCSPFRTAHYVVVLQRFYGESLPFGKDLSFSHPYIDLLTTEQALADFATLIADIKVHYNATNSPVIAFGGRLVLCYSNGGC